MRLNERFQYSDNIKQLFNRCFVDGMFDSQDIESLKTNLLKFIYSDMTEESMFEAYLLADSLKEMINTGEQQQLVYNHMHLWSLAQFSGRLVLEGGMRVLLWEVFIRPEPLTFWEKCQCFVMGKKWVLENRMIPKPRS